VRHVRMLGLCLVAALALGAYAVSSASALEWGKCELAGPGHNYTGPNCTKSEKAKPKGTGEYEWRKAIEVSENRVAEGKSAGVPFTGEGGSSILSTYLRVCEGNAHNEGEGLEIGNGAERTLECEEHGSEELGEIAVECETENATGETEGKNKVANIHVTFNGCEALGYVPCWNVEQEPNEEGLYEPGSIETNELKGKLGWINKLSSPRQVGVDLYPAASKKAHFADFGCGILFAGLEIGVGVGKYSKEGCAYQENVKKCGGDGIISPITPINEMTSTFTQEYTQNELDENIPTSFEGKPRQSLESFTENGEVPGNSTLWSRAGEVVTNVNTPEEAGEIKA
jgi:hypothetical protein